MNIPNFIGPGPAGKKKTEEFPGTHSGAESGAPKGITSGRGGPTGKFEPRIRGVKPNDPRDRLARVRDAIGELEAIGAAFTVADVAQRSGISRATLYRDHALRAQIGARGDGVRPIDPAAHARVCASHESLRARARQMRAQLQDAERRWDEMRDRALSAEQDLQRVEQRVLMLTRQLAAQPNPDSLADIAAAIGADGVRRARRKLARALHPDLFANEPDVAAVAGALLRALNEMAE
jgi:hypothetical protein